MKQSYIKKVREKLGMTQQKLGTKLKISQSAISLYECKNNVLPKEIKDKLDKLMTSKK